MLSLFGKLGYFKGDIEFKEKFKICFRLFKIFLLFFMLISIFVSIEK